MLDEQGPRSEPTRVVAIANQKGGVGKTTTAVNVGASLAELGHRTLLIDLDPQGNASTGLGVGSAQRDLSSYDLLVDDVPLAQTVVETTIPGLDAAAACIADALRDQKRIVIYGDYDVDGITASSILWHALTTLGASDEQVATYVPHRIDEGYGLNGDALRQLAADGAQVVVSPALNGGEDDDRILMGENDTATGGDGADQFATGTFVSTGEAPTITDFSTGIDNFVYFYPDGTPAPTLTLNDLGGGQHEVLADGVVVAEVTGTISLVDLAVSPG